MENNDNHELGHEVEKSKLQKVAQKISNFLRMVFINFFLKNTILGLILGFAIGSRLFEFGNFDLKGATVKIAGICKNEKNVIRADLADDEMIVSKSTDKEIGGVLRKTREYLSCNRDEVSIKKGGTISELMSKTFVTVPEIQKMKEEPIVQKDPEYLQFVGKDVVLTGSCRDVKGNLLDNVIQSVVSVTNISPSKDGTSYYIYGVRDDKVSVICDKKDIKFSLYEKKVSDSKIEIPGPEKLSYIGKKIFVSGICFPDMRVYKISGEKPILRAYNLNMTDVQVIEEGISEDKIITLSGAIIDKKLVTTPAGPISLFGHKIVCDRGQYPFEVNLANDPSIGIEQDKPVDIVK